MTTQTTSWPENVTARFLTIGGATVDLLAADKWNPAQALCLGCGTSNRDGGPGSIDPKRWAQTHAETCRAIPKPSA